MVDTNNLKTVVSGIRATGRIHLGNYHGAVKQWAELQQQYNCFFFIADYHALTTDYESPAQIKANSMQLAIDLIASGLDPKKCRIFIQSRVPEHAELHLLLSMLSPLSWLERVPTYKDQQRKLKGKDLTTYGFLGYPVLQSADVLLYKASLVPVGEDQVAHIELTREIARRFNHLYGREHDFHELAEKMLLKRVGKKATKTFRNLLKQYQEQGDKAALIEGKLLISSQQHLTVDENEHLMAYLEGTGKTLLVEPEALLTKSSKICGLDGQKMSKSYNNTIQIGESNDSITTKIKTMPTDPARVKRNDPGNPEKCPVWNLHRVYSDPDTQKWVQNGCKSANIGCVDCKSKLSEKVVEEQTPIRERANGLAADTGMMNDILAEGENEARKVASATIKQVKEAMGLI